MSRKPLLAAALLSVATTVVTTAVSLRHPDLPDEPLGLRFPGDVRVHLALGLGSGVAAPWPMPLIALVAALKDGPGRVGPARTCAIGATMLVGTVAEPASWGLRPRSDAARLTVVLHLLSGSALFLAATLRRPEAGVDSRVQP
ncbi:MAG TPA: hypothetical protein VM367_11800 [Pseudonocardia sp.]|nr:hypothetical protein [Pseudonocardia sp.]